MGEILSQEMLKTALMELVRSDKEFIASLLSEIEDKKTASIVSQRKSKKGRKLLPDKVKPDYRRDDVETWRKQFAIDKTALVELRSLFADAPPTEDILKSLTK
jgi:hypothetical protein